jgi:hypothetical protein
MNNKFDLIIFGSTSELMQATIKNHKQWFLDHINELTVVQRTEKYPEIYQEFQPKSIQLDCSNAQEFGKALKNIANQYSTSDKQLNIFPTYGQFTFDYAAKNPVFRFSENGFQINLNSRLQILEAFKNNKNARFHFFGSLLGSFPYLGDYANSMWYINQVPKNAEYRDLNLIIYNLGGMQTRFWDFKKRPDFKPFIHQNLPTDFILEMGFKNPTNRGVFTNYPSFISRIATWLGRRGVRPF